MNMVSIIDKKRHGLQHSADEIHWLVNEMMADRLPDYQLSAWLMAVCCNGLDMEETTALTAAYVQSGTVLDYSRLFDEPGIKVIDKHSTGGVGDKVTLVLLPLLAAAGLKIAKLSGRGLGFTGGTIDKLEAIPGFQTALSNEAFCAQLKTLGLALSSQTPELAPADARTYALRDVTATVESIPLIAASVVSKKIAAGADVIELDIKVGRGAFMKNEAEALELARVCREVGERLGRPIATVISRMDQPLGFAVGNALEVAEAIQTVRGKGPKDLTELCLALGAQLMVKAGMAETEEAGCLRLVELMENGEAIEMFRRWVAAQGGDVRVIDEPGLLPQARHRIPVLATSAGYVSDIDPIAVAQAALDVGAGRKAKADAILPGVGVVLHKKVGDAVEPGECLADLHADEANPVEVQTSLGNAFVLRPEAPAYSPLLV